MAFKNTIKENCELVFMRLNDDIEESINLDTVKKLIRIFNFKNNFLFLIDHKLLMANRIGHVISYKGMYLDDKNKNTYRKYTELVATLVNSNFNNVSHDIILKILDLEEQVINYISEYYKEHD